MEEESLKFCKNILKEVSRSFALTIPMLDDNIYKPVMITYLQDRLLDNFEDEIDQNQISITKRKHLMDRVVDVFDPDNRDYLKAVSEIKDNAHLIKKESLRKLTENTHILREAYQGMEKQVKLISFKWLKEMNKGMKKYLDKKITTFSELDEYCYYVAGTVGGFLTETIIYKENISETKTQILLDNYKDAGLFLQKINLIRDIKQDIRGRKKNFWPLKSLGISQEQLLDPDYQEKALQSLQKMIDDVSNHIKPVDDYFNALPDSLPGYKRFYAINNTLGLATIEKMRNNTDLFYGKCKVKVSKLQFLRILKSPEKMFIRKINDHINTV